jgi:hypothetical protein
MAKVKVVAKADPIIMQVVTACVKEALQPYVNEIVKGLLDSRQTMLLQGYVRDVLASGDLINVPVPSVAPEETSPNAPTVVIEKRIIEEAPAEVPVTTEEKESLEVFLERTVGWQAPPLPKQPEAAAVDPLAAFFK